MSKILVGILGYGKLGQYLCDHILSDPSVNQYYELDFIQNRTASKMDDAAGIAEEKILREPLQDFLDNDNLFADMVIEASHPDVIRKHGCRILKSSSLMVTSLTALADPVLLKDLVKAAQAYAHKIFIPTGAGWGFGDIKRMADRHTLKSAAIAMKFHADALKLQGDLVDKLQAYIDSDETDDCLLFDGSITDLAPLAPNNVNTMCGLALSAHTLSFDKINAKLYARKETHNHEVHIDVEGPDGFRVQTQRINPAKPGAVTGNMTFSSFLSSLMACRGKKEKGLVFV